MSRLNNCCSAVLTPILTKCFLELVFQYVSVNIPTAWTLTSLWFAVLLTQSTHTYTQQYLWISPQHLKQSKQSPTILIGKLNTWVAFWIKEFLTSHSHTSSTPDPPQGCGLSLSCSHCKPIDIKRTEGYAITTLLLEEQALLIDS